MKSKELYKLCHSLDRFNPSFDDIKLWLDKNKDNVVLLKQAANYIDETNYTPLHYLVRKKPPSDLVKRLLQLAPDTIKVQDVYYGDLPLHTAVRCSAASDVINALLQAYPQAAEVQNKGGWLPLHYALWYNASPDVINMLFDKYPQALKVRSSCKEIPFHHIF
jgi:ankyrin repeat protein